MLLLLLPSLLPTLLCRRGGRLGSRGALLLLLLLPVTAELLLAAAAGELPHSSDNAPGGCATGEEPRLWQRRLHVRHSTERVLLGSKHPQHMNACYIWSKAKALA